MFDGTPLEKFYQLDQFLKSPHKVLHLSDTLRLAVVYKVGGLYSDLDSVTIKDLSNLKNVVGATLQTATTTYHHIANGVFHFAKNHDLLLHYMERINQTYKGVENNEIGPLMLTDAIKQFYNISMVENYQNTNLTVLPSHFFFPAKSYELSLLWTEAAKSEEEWEKWLQNSSMVHFYSSQSNSIIVQRNKQHEAYSFIGPKYCPFAYNSSINF